MVIYELLTGSPPFTFDDSLTLIHWHIAKIPAAPCELDAGIPIPDIIMRLLAKTPEERYQGAQGLRSDLEHCARTWAVRRHIAAFPLAWRERPRTG